MVTVSAHAYPWDVLGDPAFADRVKAAGLDAVTLAVSYHSTRAATPQHPHRRLVDARYAALYRPVRPQAWAGRRLAPLGPDWLAEADPAGEAIAVLAAAGIPVNAWVVLAHNTRLGLLAPESTVLNCYGERYPYALCPSHPEVREHCVTLAVEALRGLPAGALGGVSLESAGQLGASHLGCHEKTDGAYPPTALRALSVCCCPGCRAGWGGLDPVEVTRLLRVAVEREEWLPAPVATALLAARQTSANRLRREVVAAVRELLPGVPVTLHAHPDPWATGPSPGLTPAAPAEVDALLVPCWPTAPASAELVKRAAEFGRPVDAYVTLLPPADPAGLPAHVRRLRAAGAERLSLYHLGLLPTRQQPLLAELAGEFRNHRFSQGS
ncbi:hypothetical protein ACIRPK_21525 [Kitasatospora sp. NPDC101801]|uniref:hypothetical protein n=1 Tax=Kitasatospora sp. NPDC101801 TaxID=3364103 RepID=UPI00382BCD18